jgi:hypothetical protein
VRHRGRSKEFVRAMRTIVDSWELGGGQQLGVGPPALCPRLLQFPGVSDLALMG